MINLFCSSLFLDPQKTDWVSLWTSSPNREAVEEKAQRGRGSGAGPQCSKLSPDDHQLLRPWAGFRATCKVHFLRVTRLTRFREGSTVT